MSEPFWTPLGGQPVDYEGLWEAGTQYAPGDVVVYNGVNYLAVNPSLGVVPPPSLAVPFIGTSLPAAPFDGMIFTLVDSLTAPTYQWRFQYLAAKATNKWLFIGGAPLIAEVVTGETCTSAAYGNLATVGPTVVVPVAGDYLVMVQFRLSGADAVVSVIYMSYDIGATVATDSEAVIVAKDNTANALYSSSREYRKALPAATLVAKYKRSAGNPVMANRLLKLTPLAVGG